MLLTNAPYTPQLNPLEMTIGHIKRRLAEAKIGNKC